MTAENSSSRHWLLVIAIVAATLCQLAVLAALWRLSATVQQVESRQQQLQVEVNSLKEKTLPEGVESINRGGE